MTYLKKADRGRNAIIRSFILVMTFLLASSALTAQPPALSIGHTGVCNVEQVLVPVAGTNLVSVGAITLFIAYDSTALSFKGLADVNPQLTGVMVNTLTNPSRITIVWSKTTGANFPGTLLFNLNFTPRKDTLSLVSFIPEFCELANVALPPQIINATYNDGSTFPSVPQISAGPENRTIPSQSNATFQVSSPNASDYTWQESRNGGIQWNDLQETATYQGTSGNVLTIRQVPSSFNQFQYRCILKRNNCPLPSPAALLVVDSIAGLHDPTAKDLLRFSNSPNPFAGKTTFTYSVPEEGDVSITIHSVTGPLVTTVIQTVQKPGEYRHDLNFVSLPPGIYYGKYLFTNRYHRWEKTLKMVHTNQQ